MSHFVLASQMHFKQSLVTLDDFDDLDDVDDDVDGNDVDDFDETRLEQEDPTKSLI